MDDVTCPTHLEFEERSQLSDLALFANVRATSARSPLLKRQGALAAEWLAEAEIEGLLAQVEGRAA